MKTCILRVLAALMLIAMAMSVTACSAGTIYDEFAEQGYTVRVRFEPNGAVVNETDNVGIVELFDANDIITTAEGKTGIRLLDPKDPARGEGVFTLSRIDGKNYYFQAGWYTTRTPRVDEQGRALDAYGELTSVSGREQGYVYSGKWDFEKDVVDPTTLENGEFTLYAAWVPFYTYEFYAQNDQNTFELIGSVTNKLTLTLPKYNERTGKWDMKDLKKLPTIDGMEFAAAYADEALTQKLETEINGTGYVDYEQGIATQNVIKVFLTYTAVVD